MLLWVSSGIYMEAYHDNQERYQASFTQHSSGKNLKAYLGRLSPKLHGITLCSPASGGTGPAEGRSVGSYDFDENTGIQPWKLER